MSQSIHCEDFEVDDILIPDDATLCRFLERRFEGDSNRFILSLWSGGFSKYHPIREGK